MKKLVLSLQGLRGFSIILVLFYHFQIPYFKGGFIGVDFFFILSGYLIAKILEKEINFKDFIISRFLRLAPTLLVAILVTIFLGYIFYNSEDFLRLAEVSLSSILFVSNFYVMFEEINYFVDTKINFPLLHTWSLSIEFMLYIFTFLFYKFFKKKIELMMIIFIILSLLTTLIITNSIFNFYSPITRIWELFLGCMAYRVKKKSYFKNKLILNFSFIILVFSFCFFSKNTNHPGFITFVPALCLFINLLHQKYFFEFFLNNKILVFFGNISYSLYIWHYIILIFAQNFINTNEYVSKFFLIFLSIIVSIINYKFIDQRFRK